VGVFQASRTGGAPGPVTYAWSEVSKSGPSNTAFLNPTNASSQQVVFTGMTGGVPASSTIRCTITDSLGNSDLTPTATANASTNFPN
jgi:hypothetical protein